MKNSNTTTKANTLPGNPDLPTPQEELLKLVPEGSKNMKYSVEDFFRNPEKARYLLSPGGDYFSYMGPYKRRQNIFVQKIGTTETTQITHTEDRDIAWYFWANDNRIVYGKDSGGDENFQLFAVNIDGSGMKELTPFDGVKIDVIDDLKDIPGEIIISMNKNNPQLFEPYRLNIETGAFTQLAVNDNPLEPISEWITDHEGKLRLASKIKGGTNNTLLYRDKESEDFREVLTTDFREGIEVLFFDFDNGPVVYVSSNLNRDKAVITKFDMHMGKEVGEIIFEHPEVDVSALAYSRKRKVLTVISYTTDKKHFHFLDEERAALQKKLETNLPGYEIVISNASRDESKYMIRTYSDRSLGAYYFYDKNTDKLEEIVAVSPWLNEADMASMKPVSYPARDGLKINGYLSLPNGKESKNLPVVINPHGGPWHRDVWGYNPEVQLLCQQGYAVLQMNFRGSTGYGRAFWEASFKQWGRKMQDDITDGVDWLIQQGIADPKRIAIYGGSYGGYATLAGLAFTPDLYVCGVDYVGVSNLFSFMKTLPPYWKPYLEMMYTMVGHPEEDAQNMTATSPALHADKITAPLFVIQGANDPRVHINESDQMVMELRARGIDVPYMVKYDEGHGFGNEENRFEVYKIMLGFLGKYLG